MALDDKLDRRKVLAAGMGLLAAAPPIKELAGKPIVKPLDPDAGVTAPEALMKEHGLLNRCLLIYEEGIRRVQAKEEVASEVFLRTAELVRVFIEDYHEKNEENLIFPEFVKFEKLVDLVETLKAQHAAGRKMTAEVYQLSQPTPFRVEANREQIVAACQSFIRMYRPHMAREETVLFPALRTILSAKRVEVLGERIKEEQAVLGGDSFEHSLEKLAKIEAQLGIEDLKQLMPKG